MDRFEREALDRHITGNYGEDFFAERDDANPSAVVGGDGIDPCAVVEFGGATYVLQSHTYTLKEYAVGSGPFADIQVGSIVDLDADEEMGREAGKFLIISARTYEFGGQMVEDSGTVVDIVSEEGIGHTLTPDLIAQFLRKNGVEDIDGDA